MTQTAQEFQTALCNAIDMRVAYENNKSASANGSIVSTLLNIKKSANHESIASVMLASNVDADFINKSERVNARMNVYAAEKVVNVARHVASVATLNHYTLAILRTAIALEAASLVLTHKDAVSACSKDVKHSEAAREKIIKTTRYAKVVSANTASTQSSSSINALQVMKFLNEARDASNVVTYTLNRENAACAALIKLLA